MKNQRLKFNIPERVTYLNCAYMSPLMRQVEEAGMQGMARKRNPLTITAEDFFAETEVLRKEFARLLSTRDSKRVVVIPSASYGLSTVARNIPLSRGEKVVLIDEQFPSNVYPWRRLAAESGASLDMVKAPDTLDQRGRKWNERILDAITRETRVVAMGNVHWADGTLFDLKDIGKRAREVGAKLIVDGTQSVGAMPFDMAGIRPDALICAGYKWLMGPYSIGLAYLGEAFDGGVPLEENWINRLGSEDFTGLIKYQDNYQPGALRYEVGEHSNFVLVPMMLEALRQVNRWGVKNIQQYCGDIAAESITLLRERGHWIEDDGFRGNHLFGIRFSKGFAMQKIKERIKKKRIAVSFRGDSMRISPHVYNTKEDLRKLVDVISS